MNKKQYTKSQISKYNIEINEKFLLDLEKWIKTLYKLKYENDNNNIRLKYCINLINKLIFVKILYDYNILEKNPLNKLDKSRPISDNKFEKIIDFTNFINKIFYKYAYNNIFKEEFLSILEKSDDNINRFYDYLISIINNKIINKNSSYFGINYYNFRQINVDIFGKSYEIFLKSVKKKKGIYYTPKYIVQFIVENTVGELFDKIIDKIEQLIKLNDYNNITNYINEFISLKILDPACGTGTFLIESLIIIWKKYLKLIQLLNQINNLNLKNAIYKLIIGNLIEFNELKVRDNEKFSLCIKIILRHLYGVDLDINALEITIFNLNLEVIKLNSTIYKLLDKFNHHFALIKIIHINFINGNSLIGLPNDKIIHFLTNNFKNDLKYLMELRTYYLDNPTNIKLISKILNIKERIRKKLDKEFYNYLKDLGIEYDISQIKPIHWALEYFFIYFNEDLNPLNLDLMGFDSVIGNPPYIEYRNVKPLYIHIFLKNNFESCKKNKEKYNLFVPFVELSLNLIKKDGKFGFIIPINMLSSLMSKKLRSFILENYKIDKIIDLSNIKVFKKSSTYPILLFISKIPPDKIQISYKTDETEIINRTIRYNSVDQLIFLNKANSTILIDVSKDVLNLIRKIENKGRKLSEFAKLKWGTSKSGYKKLKISNYSYEKLNSNEKKDYMKIIQSSDIKQYIIDWKGEYIQTSLYSSKQIKLFKVPKIVISRQSTKLKAALDTSGIYALGKVAFIPINELKIDPYLLIALLNSLIIDFYFKKIYETLHMSNYYIRYDIPYLNQIPILINNDYKIINLTKKYIILNEFLIEIKKFWNNYLLKISEINKINVKILENNYINEFLYNNLKINKNNNNFKIKFLFFPLKIENLLSKQFKKFEIIIENNDIINIFGLNKSNYELILKLKIFDNNLRNILFLCLFNLIESKQKLKTFKYIMFWLIIFNILSKNNLYLNEINNYIIKKINLLKTHYNINLDYNLFKYYNEINSIKNLIDAYLFKLYNLNLNEIKLILNTLGISKIKSNDIIKKFTQIL